MVLDPSLDLIAGWGDREIHRPVDKTDASSACATAAFGNNFQNVFRGFGQGFWTR